MRTSFFTHTIIKQTQGVFIMDITQAVIDTIFRSIGAVIALEFLARINGPKQISQLSFYDYITGITIGSMAAVMAIDDQIPFYIPLISMIVFILLTYIEGKWTLRSLKARQMIDGTPILLMADGKILQKQMKKARMTVNDLLSEARVAGYFNLQDVSFAVMENSGKISFLPFAQNQPVTCGDMKIKKGVPTLYVNIIIDGVILHNELRDVGLNEPWLMEQLKKQETALDQVLLGIVNKQGKLYLYRKHESTKHNEQL